MISFEVSAIDLILVVAVVVLLLLYWSKLSKIPDEPVFRGLTADLRQGNDYSCSPSNCEECPRGFGNIKRLDDSGPVSERCLGCYKIMECYSGDDVTASPVASEV